MFSLNSFRPEYNYLYFEWIHASFQFTCSSWLNDENKSFGKFRHFAFWDVYLRCKCLTMVKKMGPCALTCMVCKNEDFMVISVLSPLLCIWMVTLPYPLLLEKHLHLCFPAQELASAAASLTLLTLRFSMTQLFAHLAIPACLTKRGRRWWCVYLGQRGREEGLSKDKAVLGRLLWRG